MKAFGLAADIPALWSAPTTTAIERQVIARQVLDRVIVTVLDDTEKVNVELHWIGGHQTRTQITRPVARLEQLSYYRDLLARVAALSAEGLGLAQLSTDQTSIAPLLASGS